MYKKLLAGILAGCLLLSSTITVSAAEPEPVESAAASETVQESDTENAQPEETADADTEDEALQLKEAPPADSWRYQNGERIDIEQPILQPGTNEIEIMEAGRYRRGIDVSEWQKRIDWEQVKASGIEFAIIRCGFSVNKEKYDDKYWRRNVAECERLGIPYGVYIYSYAQDTDWALSEAEHVLRLIKGHNPYYPIYFDMEDNTTLGCDLAAIATAFCNRITEAGYRTGIYSNLTWWNKYLTAPCFSQWDRWVAQWNNTCTYKGAYSIWQYSSKGEVPGIDGFVDMNYLIADDYPEDAGIVKPDPSGGEEAELPFFDVVSGDWFYDSVRYVSNARIMTGMSSDRFGYGDILSRAQFVTILYRMEDEPSTDYSPVFPDVAEREFYTNAVMWAKLSGAGVVEGYEDGTFGPANPITREQLVLMMYRYAASLGKDVTARAELGTYPDAASVSAFAEEAMEWAIATGVIQGDQGNINPQGKATRAECATIIMRFLEEL